jgi:hypothetical protein
MRWVALAIWFCSGLLALAWAHGVRHLVQRGGGAQPSTINTAMLFGLGALLPVTGLSPFHLLWFLPASYLWQWRRSPFSPLSIPARLYARLCCACIDWQLAASRGKTLEAFRKAHVLDGMPAEAARTFAESQPEAVRIPDETIEDELKVISKLQQLP